MKVCCPSQSDKATGLVRRYRQGERAALGELYDELAGLVRAFIQTRLLGLGSLPVGLEVDDLYQQSYIFLAEAVEEWEPSRCDSFVAYFLVNLRWRMERYLRQQTSLRRSTRIRLSSVPHDYIVKAVAERIGVDGREWDGEILCSDLMGALPTLDREVVRLHLFRGLTFVQIGDELGISRSACHRAYSRAIVQLKKVLSVER